MPFTMPRVLNRRPMLHDHRDYRMADFITPAMRKLAAQLIANEWPVNRVLDQGPTGHCVGFAWAGFGISLPVFDDWQNEQGDKIYYAAKVIDGEPLQEDGSDTRSGVKAFSQFSQLLSYAFAGSLDDIVTWLLTAGPVVTGTNWYQNMFDPDANGLVSIGGAVAGGHEWLLSGVDVGKQQFLCTNSWGVGWGVKGQFYIGFADYQRLLNEQGDACMAIESTALPVPTPAPVPAPAPDPQLAAIATGFLAVARNPSIVDARLARALRLAATDLGKAK